LANWERREWIRLLYDHIKQKKKVIVNKRVEKIEESDDGVSVTTSDGDTFSGDMLVGADGVHSIVREAMWRNAGLEPKAENQSLHHPRTSSHCNHDASQKERKGRQEAS
jgi:2-polyprenyl-6-methoxyphenol hydroxylase-like FAD-dependent oxidoreductase